MISWLLDAASYGIAQIAEVLNIHGADIDLMYRGGTALSFAVQYQASEIVNLLF